MSESAVKSIVVRLGGIKGEIDELMEELEMMSDEELMKALGRSKEAFKEGKYHTFREIKETHKKLGRK